MSRLACFLLRQAASLKTATAAQAASCAAAAEPAGQRLPRRWPAGILLTAVALAPPQASAAPAAHAANPGDAADAAIVRAAGDEVAAGQVRNSCGSEVRPVISHPAANVAVVIEADPTGACSGSSPPSSLTVLVRGAGGWRLSTSTTGSGYRVGQGGGAMPIIVVQYPPSQVDCPVLSWTGGKYSMTRYCRAPGS